MYVQLVYLAICKVPAIKSPGPRNPPDSSSADLYQGRQVDGGWHPDYGESDGLGGVYPGYCCIPGDDCRCRWVTKIKQNLLSVPSWREPRDFFFFFFFQSRLRHVGSISMKQTSSSSQTNNPTPRLYGHDLGSPDPVVAFPCSSQPCNFGRRSGVFVHIRSCGEN